MVSSWLPTGTEVSEDANAARATIACERATCLSRLRWVSEYVTPLELLALVCLLGIVRAAIGIVPAPVAAGPKAAWRPVVREYLDSFIIAALVALFLITFVVRSFFIPSASMESTLQIHDVLLVDEFEYRLRPPHDEDIAVFTPPVPSPDNFIKRVIASPGDTLRIHDGIVYCNGIALHEAYIAQKARLRACNQELRDLRRRIAARCAGRERPAAVQMEFPQSGSGRLLFHVRRQSQ